MLKISIKITRLQNKREPLAKTEATICQKQIANGGNARRSLTYGDKALSGQQPEIRRR